MPKTVQRTLKRAQGRLLRPLEKYDERRFVKEVRTRLRCKTRKLNGPGQRAWCDQLVLGPNGFWALIEFKREGEGLEPLQQDHHDELVKLGHAPRVFVRWEDAFEFVSRGIQARA